MSANHEGPSMASADADAEDRLDAYFKAREKEEALKALEERKSPELKSVENRLKESVVFVREELDKIFSTETDLRTIKKKVKKLIDLFEHIT